MMNAAIVDAVVRMAAESRIFCSVSLDASRANATAGANVPKKGDCGTAKNDQNRALPTVEIVPRWGAAALRADKMTTSTGRRRAHREARPRCKMTAPLHGRSTTGTKRASNGCECRAA